jgi:hypothetical protein
MPSLTFLLLRFTGVLVFLLPLVVLFRAPWPHGRIRHVAVAGVLLQAGYLAGSGAPSRSACRPACRP